jgi:hypothetical protein
MRQPQHVARRAWSLFTGLTARGENRHSCMRHSCVDDIVAVAVHFGHKSMEIHGTTQAVLPVRLWASGWRHRPRHL